MRFTRRIVRISLICLAVASVPTLRSAAQALGSGSEHPTSKLDIYAGYGFFHPVDSTLAGYYYQDIKNVANGKDADPIMYSVRGKYALSKRTDLYLSAAYAKAKNQQLVGLSRDDLAYGSSQTGVIAGIQHRF